MLAFSLRRGARRPSDQEHSLGQGLRQARREAALWGQPTLRFTRHTSEPTLRALAVEDTAALAGVAPAATGVLVRQLGARRAATRPPRW